MVAHERWGGGSAGATCPAPMTRAALLALRASAGLSKDCDYVITDHVQGRLVAGTTIHLQAVDATTLSMAASVKTTYDNVAWAGIYDVDRALVLELTDNRGNVAKGLNGTEVANFDWGNAAWHNVTVNNGSLTVTYGNPAIVNNVEVHAATLNLTGFSGQFYQNVVRYAANVNFTNANGIWRYSEWWGGGLFNATGYAGGGDSYYNEWNITNINLSGLTGAAAFHSNEVVGGSITATGAATFSLQSSVLQNMTINRPATGGTFAATQLTSRESGSITHNGAGALNITGSQINGGLSLTGTGGVTFNYCRAEQSCSVNNAGAGLLWMTRTTLDDGSSNVTVDAGSNKAVTVNDCNLSSTGLIRVVGAVGGGAFTITNSKVSAAGYIYHRGTGTLSIAQSEVQASGIDVLSGDRSYNMTRFNMRAVSRAALTGTGAVTDSLNDFEMAERGTLTVSCSGAANAVSYCVINGLSGSISLTGTTGAQSANRLKCNDGSINFANTTVNVGAALISANDAGVISISGVTTVKNVQYMTASSQGTITINNSTGGGTISSTEVVTAGSYVVSGAAAGASGVFVSRGTLAHNGGTLSGVTKAGSGTLTTGNFNHTNIAAFLNASKTLTAANTNRQDNYTGGPLL